MDSKRTLLGMPGYGRQTAAAGRALWLASRDMDAVAVKYQHGSLLAQNFNSLWCWALNRVHHGGQVDYFAMLHDDVGAEDFWLDKLIVELDEKNLDVLGVVSPIKDTRGLTSIALHREGDNWQPACRLTMNDVYRLPSTFTSEDLGAKLLINTGCWVCRFDMSWVTQVHFEIRDAIGFNKATNSYIALNESEDWYFSRLLHEIGQGPTATVRPLRIGATRKVKLDHRGEMDFTNTRPWGSSFFDREAVEQSPIPETDRDGFRWPYDVRGWLSPDEGKELWRLAAGKDVLEIGSFCGCSTICLAQSARSVVAVDYFDGRATTAPGETFAEFSANLHHYRLKEKVRTTAPESILPPNAFDLAFIDGAHDRESVAADIVKARRALRPGGLLLFHDYKSPKDPGVTKAVDELLGSGGDLLAVVESLAVVRSPANTLCEV